ncbi:MAG: response regulator [bacterium]|nr:response regulator [bacterium]
MTYDILVVDDSKAALFMFKKIVNFSGAPVGTILTAENGKHAIDVLKVNHVDLIMTDINMPEMNGFELIEYLKRNPSFRDIPIIVITTEGRDKYIAKAKLLGAVNYIKKPFQPEQVKQLILETLGVEENETNIPESEASDF